MYLFFDTETTGLPKNWRAPITDLENWPRLVQLAWLLYDNDGKELESQNYIVKPEGFVIPEQAANVHGISTEKAMQEGEVLADILQHFANSMNKSKYLVAHNMNFDEKIMGAEFLRKGINSDIFDLPKICTMHSSIDYCQIPSNYGFKWPSLMELHTKLFDKGFDDAHDALVDVKACARCFFELKNRGILDIF